MTAQQAGWTLYDRDAEREWRYIDPSGVESVASHETFDQGYILSRRDASEVNGLRNVGEFDSLEEALRAAERGRD